ncbi:MYOM1 isoform 4 [Pongo abelii]|uniref:Myomesin-1 n=1 Tax=Pongo abelii TaxID=9601 RepID=A0A2J8XH36_PONAB|nr:MYOM1 isoform 4 [Pongo abelii]
MHGHLHRVVACHHESTGSANVLSREHFRAEGNGQFSLPLSLKAAFFCFSLSQRSHQHYDLSYRNKDLRTTVSHYQREKKRSAIYTQGSTAYSSRSSAAHRQESQAFRQASASSFQQQASQYALSSEVSRKAASAYDYGSSHGLTDSSLLLDDYSSKLSPKPKRAKHSLLSGEEKENLPSDYMVPIFSGRIQCLKCGTLNLVKLLNLITAIHNIYILPLLCFSQKHVSGITDREEERIKEAAAYIAQRNLLASEEGITTSKQSTASKQTTASKQSMASKQSTASKQSMASRQSMVSKQATSTLQQEETSEKKSRKVVIREKAEHLSLRKTLEETEAYHAKLNEDHLLHAPEFIIKPRSHTVWEKEKVKLHCSIAGWPEPRVTWYKNQVPINVHANPGKYIIESRYGMHTLEINACDFEDTAQYRASAMNVKGELSAYASVVVKRYKGEFDETRFHAGASTMPLSFGVTPYGYASKFEIHFDDKFDVSFGREGETMSLGCRVVITPEIKHFQPEIQWYRNGVPLSPSKWVQTLWSGERATLTFSHLNKEDEGLYTIRVRMGEYYEQYSAYVFVRDADAEIEGAPAAPLDVKCLEANKDYIIISWKQPAVDGGSPILGYFIDKCEVGTDSWSQCNDTPVKFARFPVTGLIEGRSYIFRVRAVNKTGIGFPSRVSEPVAALDPAEKARLKSRPSAPWTGQIIVTEEEPSEGIVPGPPTDLCVTEATRSYVVLSWKPPGQRGHEGIMYFVEKCEAGTENWQRVNTELPVKSPRFALFDLAEGKSYCFRVRCSNSAGVGEPSEATEVTVVGDKLDIPKAPGKIIPSRNTDTSVVVSWEESKDAKELVGYYIEASVAGSGKWEPCNNNPVKGSRFTCHGLVTGQSYIFRVRAVNAAGLSEYSQDSEAIEVKAAIGPPHSLKCSEVRKDSLVLHWRPPVHSGRTPVTGYFVDLKEAKAKEDQWRGLNEAAIKNMYLKVRGLKEGVSYVFRVRAINQAGVGKPSDLAGPVVAETRPGTKEVVVNVDDDGVISLNFECDKMTPKSEFSWSKDYVSTEDSPRLEVESKGNKTKMTFKDLGMDDLGIYSCDVTDTDGIASSYLIDEEELKRLLALSHDHKFPTVPVKSELAVEILEKGQVRFWMQAEKLSGNAKVNYIFNEKEIFEGPKYKMHIDRNTGIIEMFMEKLQDEDEGTYTFQLQDGKATNHSTVVLIGDVFKKLQKETEFQRQEWIRKQGPHFVEYLSWEVTGECNVLLKCKVANIKKETHIVWYKDEREISVDEKHDFKDGICTLLITEFSKKDAGIYEVILKDDRGKDKSRLKLVDEAFKELMTEVCKKIALSATDLKIQSTAEGIRLYSFVTYYVEDLKVNWSHNGTAIRYSDRVKTGVTGEQIWLQINEPTPNDKGKYVMELFDGKTGHQKTVDLSGQAYDEAYAEFQRLKRYVCGLQLGALNLTCNVWGDPPPEVSWLKNEKALASDDHCNLKFEAGKTAYFTINGVSTADSGKYGLVVKNKYGSETSDFTVSVFIPEEEARMAALESLKGGKKAK